MPAFQVGNEFIVTKPDIPQMKVEVSTPDVSIAPQPLVVTVEPAHHLSGPVPTEPSEMRPSDSAHNFGQIGQNSFDFIKKYRIASFAILFLVFGYVAIQVAASYWSAAHVAKPVAAAAVPAGKPTSGFNMTVPAAELQQKLQTITSQPVTLSVGQYSEQVSSDNIKSWLQITANKSKTEYYLHVNEAAMVASLNKEANDYTRTPVHQVTVNEDGQNVVVVAGKDGRSLSDPNTLKTQAKDAAKNVLAAKGLQFSTPLQTAPFQAVGAGAFDKLLVANVTTKKMWAYQNGQQVNSFLVSAGAPATPTPLGEFHVYAKFSVQDMSGFNPNGTKYFQPKVPWVSYFYQGSAVHGVYWHPSTWFGNINSSHGCVGLQVDQAQWVYNWDSIGTTVITHA